MHAVLAIIANGGRAIIEIIREGGEGVPGESGAGKEEEDTSTVQQQQQRR